MACANRSQAKLLPATPILTVTRPIQQSTEDDFQQIYQSKNYSSIFKILLNYNQDEDSTLRRKRVSSMSFGREDPEMKFVHDQMKSYLKSEEEAMEERIRKFEDQERVAFLNLQERAHRERSLLFLVIAKAQETYLAKEKQSVNIKTDNSSSNEPDSVQTDQKYENPATEKVKITILNDYLLTRPKISAPIDSEASSLFTLEGFDEEQEQDFFDQSDHDSKAIAFPQSDDEDNSTNDSSYRDTSALSGLNLATSMPVNIPLFYHHSKDSSITSPTKPKYDDGFESGDVGHSIRQLALSVQDTGMFGDLPRPRMMTNPFT